MYIIMDKKKLELHNCVSLHDRFKGFMFTKNIDCCLKFDRCRSVHTFFMLENIDIVMTDQNNNVLYIFNNVKPWHVILPKKGAFITYEFPANTVKKDIKKITIGGKV